MKKKCLISFFTYTLFSAVCLISMHLMLLIDVNKYVGVGIGSGILAISFVLYMIFRKNCKLRGWILLFLFASAIGSGLAISSLYVYLGAVPSIIYSFCVWGAYVILFLAYCLFANIPLFKRFPRICMFVYGLLAFAGGIIGIVLSSKIIFSLALMIFILFISYLATIVAHSNNLIEHTKKLALASFIGLFIIVIVVLIVISEGDSLDALDVYPGSGSHKKSKTNPYDFSQNGNHRLKHKINFNLA